MPSTPRSAAPRWATPRSPERATYGPRVATVARLLGWPPMLWQRDALDVALEVDPATGEWCYPTVVITVQRQAGKSTLVVPTAVHRCVTGTDRRCWYTAQTRADARDAFMDTVPVFRRSPLRNRIKIRESNGSEGIHFPTGSSWRIFAPHDEALHGKANALVVIDEAWAFTELEGDALIQAIVPGFTTTAGQLWIISAAGTHESTWLRGHIEAGRALVDAGRRDGVCYIEYGIDDDIDPADLDAVLAAHPANGYTLRPAALAAAAASMKPGEFARAYGNRFTGAAERVIGELVWALAAEATPPHPGRGGVALGFDVGLDETDAAIVAGWRDETGRAHVEVADARAGTSWLVPRLAELVTRWAPLAVGHDSAGPVLAAADAATRAGIELSATTSRDYGAACSAFLSALVAGHLRHTPHPALDAAVAAATKRSIGDGGWGWGRRASGTSIAPLVAATQAVWAYDHAPRIEPFAIL